MTNERNEEEKLDHLEVIGIPVYFGSKIINVFTYYNPPEKPIDHRIFKFAESRGEFVFLGDFNAHVPPDEKRMNPRGIELSNILATSVGTIINELDIHQHYKVKITVEVTDFDNELNRKLIDDMDEPLELMCHTIANKIKKAAERTIPKSKANNNQKIRYPNFVKDAISAFKTSTTPTT